ncbi:ABC transporter ATP-binding protein [Caballeronia sp. DA-9]|uniref:ABC transporter ATP-binding protein n=1 Tax=Caballeronia sp. DA-9 TaxID=3436237 RepID=UPI003F66EA16
MLRIDSIHAGYGTTEVLHGVSLEVAKGRVVSLIGSNGAGKTTTMRVISGMLRARAGIVMLNGQDITQFESFKVARLGLAHSPEGRHVFPTLSVRDNLELGAFARFVGKRRKGDIKSYLERAMDLFPILRKRATQQAGTLSGGEQQMLAMARAIMLDPEVVLLDEPSMGLAPLLVDEVFRTIERLKQDGVTMLVVEQFAAAALQVSDYGYVLENGKVAIEGPAVTLRDNKAVQAAYLGGMH